MKNWSEVEKTNLGCIRKYEGSLLNDQCSDIKKGLIEILIRLSSTTLLLRLGEVGFEMNKTSVLPPGALLWLSESLVWYVASMNVLYQT